MRTGANIKKALHSTIGSSRAGPPHNRSARQLLSHSTRKTAPSCLTTTRLARPPVMAPSRPPRPPTRPARDPKELLKKRGADLIRKVSDKDRYAIFLEPVDVAQVAGYADLIERPMDLSTAQKNLQMGVYRTPMELRADLDLIWSNCCTFNADDSIFYKEAVRLRALAARYYDDLVRVLSRDGVAAALGLTSSRQNRPAARLVGKRPPRHRPQSGAAQSSSLHTSEPTSPEADADASASASASGSGSAGQLSSFRDVQIRRAQAAAEAAASAASIAEEEARSAAIAAGVPPNAYSSSRQIFAGPGGAFRDKTNNAGGLPARQFRTLNPQKFMYRCSEIPLAWRRIGRWHTRGATISKFNSRERAWDVRYGRMFQRYVQRSAPLARRLLATVLDAEVVRQHDLNIISLSSAQVRPNGVHNGVEKNGRKSHVPSEIVRKQVGAVPMATQNGRHHSLVNGMHSAMEVDDESRSKATPDRAREGGFKRPRGRSAATLANMGTVETNGSKGELFVDLLLRPDDLREVPLIGREDLSKQCRSPSRRSISRLQLLLKEHSIDPSFLAGLLSGLPNSEARKTGAHLTSAEGKEGTVSPAISLDRLLSANYSTLMNVLRLRSLRESADEAECEDLEDRERECVEGLAKGMSLAVRKLPPRLVVHPADAMEGALAMSQSMQRSQLLRK